MAPMSTTPWRRSPTYVGHAKISDTYWYLTGVPDLMAVAGKRFELFAARVGGDHHA
jgi:integrase/recombinase XerD